ncbi:Maf-like protein [Pararhizobium sp.]|uniref:Maf-like protein n=1 Tax=Pararhizobium sp. TaxID=1977563 RepID=UPI00272307C4|nr:Maf-like protein [Pararhizobium sp.]MDO9416799.1 Maf-like protein [Pararhizobium sp.]
MKHAPLILASSSAVRRTLLENAGLVFSVEPAVIDERAIEGPLEQQGAKPDQIALVLASEKAADVSRRFPGHLVIGSDQTMSLGNRVYHKPADMFAARTHLLSLSGKDHHLNSAVALAFDGRIVWDHISSARLAVRQLTPDFVDRHLEQVGEQALQSVGAYQLEGPGLQLFDTIEGDYFAILGLPMLPLLKALRERGALNA